uniref:Uncharacterized protein n=1 Tax=Candidatus Kentrum sp. TC TaxID=2126339 RepID=A0A451A9J6_9GAMM|nr:MAG: hypothetical protein BECKTC1821F_GA0114240_107813 [Candidatus Kentron sp. TC]
MKATIIAIFSLSMICLMDIIVPMASARESILPDHALTIYAGRVTKDHWEETLLGDVHFADASMVAGAVSWTVERFFDNALSFELEGQVAKYFGLLKKICGLFPGREDLQAHDIRRFRWHDRF